MENKFARGTNSKTKINKIYCNNFKYLIVVAKLSQKANEC